MDCQSESSNVFLKRPPSLTDKARGCFGITLCRLPIWRITTEDLIGALYTLDGQGPDQPGATVH